LEKRVKEKQLMRTECNRPNEEREGWSTELTDGQGGSSLLVDQWVKLIGQWSTGGSADGKEEGGNQEDAPEGKHGGGRSVHDWRQVKESV
jgi:hypothetical protein